MVYIELYIVLSKYRTATLCGSFQHWARHFIELPRELPAESLDACWCLTIFLKPDAADRKLAKQFHCFNILI